MERILVVEDEASIRKALSVGLALDGFEVDLAQDGKAGILLGSRKEYDIMITDLNLPDIYGLEVIKEIKQIFPETIPIIITGYASMESSLEAIRLEVSDYIEKPLSMESVKTSIKRGLEKRFAKRKTMHDRLQQMLQTYKKEFSDAAEAIQAIASDRISEKIPMLVHQINNPLMSIVGSAELGMLQLDESDALKQYLTGIIKATEKIKAINTEILKLQHPAEEKIERVDLGVVLNNCLKLFKDLMVLKNISLENHIRKDQLFVSGNKFSLEQVFKNLILNAIDSMDESREKRLSIRTEVDKDSSTISVNIEDTGCGISKDSISKIFMPHYTSKQHGTGLGLPVVKNVVEKNKGKIYVESEVGQGTTFMVSLPLEEGGRGS